MSFTYLVSTLNIKCSRKYPIVSSCATNAMHPHSNSLRVLNSLMTHESILADLPHL